MDVFNDFVYDCSKVVLAVTMTVLFVSWLSFELRVSDCNLEEEEIVKLATVGHESNSQDAIDVLKKSLVIRNK